MSPNDKLALTEEERKQVEDHIAAVVLAEEFGIQTAGFDRLLRRVWEHISVLDNRIANFSTIHRQMEKSWDATVANAWDEGFYHGRDDVGNVRNNPYRKPEC